MFQPTSGKWSEQDCFGFFLHVTQQHDFMPYRPTLALLQAVMSLYPDDFQYKEPPYEYEYERLPIDLILGDVALRKQLEDGLDLLELEKSWKRELVEFDHLRKDYFLYN